jgi:Autographiviridae endonuclease VII
MEEEEVKDHVQKNGITQGEYAIMLSKQGYKCAICRRLQQGGIRFCVDHNHRTGEVRGLLCTQCNRAIGNFEDDPLRCLMASYYLRGELLCQQGRSEEYASRICSRN